MKTYEARSIAQHNTEWLYYQIIADETGHSAYEIYENMASRLLKVIDYEGDLCYIKPSSLNTMQHNNYTECVRLIAAEFGIILPDPTHDIAQHYKLKKLRKASNGRK